MQGPPLQRALMGLAAARSVADYRRETQQVLDALDSSSSTSCCYSDGDAVWSVSLLVSVQQTAAAAALQQLLRCLPSLQQQQRKGPAGLSAKDGLLLLSVVSRADNLLGASFQGSVHEEEIAAAAQHLDGAVEAVLLLLQHVSSSSRTRLLLEQQQQQQQHTAVKGAHAAAAAAEWEKSCTRVLQLLLKHSKVVDRLPQTRKSRPSCCCCWWLLLLMLLVLPLLLLLRSLVLLLGMLLLLLLRLLPLLFL